MTSILLIANIACFFVFGFLEYNRVPVAAWLALSVDGLKHGLIYQLLTFQFMHANFMHLLGNMLVFFFFGRAMEHILGRNGLLKLYLASGTMGGLVQILFGILFPERFAGSVVGVSAGVFGLVAAFAMSRPNQPVLLFFILPMPAKYLLVLEGVITIYGIAVPAGNVAHAAHLGGMLAGMAYIHWLSKIEQLEWPQFLRRAPRVMITPPKKLWRSSPRQRKEDVLSDEFISDKVDPILEKISARGLHSLTEEERKILEAARRKMAQR